MSIELRYHPLIPNRTCQRWNCPHLANITFEDIRVTGAARAGDIHGFRGDLLENLRFKNVSFARLPHAGWTCGYVDLSTFVAEGVSPTLNCSGGPNKDGEGLGPLLQAAQPSPDASTAAEAEELLPGM